MKSSEKKCFVCLFSVIGVLLLLLNSNSRVLPYVILILLIYLGIKVTYFVKSVYMKRDI